MSAAAISAPDDLLSTLEVQLLLSCARTHMDEVHAERVRRLLDSPIDWDQVRTLARRHGLIPLLSQNLTNLCPDRVPADVLKRLQRRSQRISLRNLGLMQELLRVLRALEQQGILVVTLKGPVLANMAYGSLSLRGSDDLDIIVRKRDLQKTLDVLKVLGYSSIHYQTSHHYHLHHATNGIVLEVHWRFIQPQKQWSKLNFEEMVNRTVSSKLSGVTILTLAPPDSLLYLCLHGSKHFWRRLRWVCDIAEIITRYGPEDWNVLIAEAKRQQAQRILGLGLLMAHDLLDASIPDNVPRELAGWSASQEQADQMKQQMFLDQPVAVLARPLSVARFHLSDRRLERWRLAAVILLKQLRPMNADRNLLRLPRVLSPFYYVVRMVRLLVKYRAALWGKVTDLFGKLPKAARK